MITESDLINTLNMALYISIIILINYIYIYANYAIH